MILIITHKDDYTADYVINKLNKLNILYFRFNCEDYLQYKISLHFEEKESFTINGYTTFSSVWYRRTKLPDIKANNEGERIFILNEIDAFIHNLFGVIKLKWLSNPLAILRAENKFMQLSLAKKIGFNVPKTLITTDKRELTSFINNNRKTVIKPVSKGRINYPNNTSKLIFTNIITKKVIDEIESFELTPAIYQEYIDKEYELRVTVIGKDIFSASVNSQESEALVDWRRKKIKFEKYDLPPDLKEKCFSLLKALNIS